MSDGGPSLEDFGVEKMTDGVPASMEKAWHFLTEWTKAQEGMTAESAKRELQRRIAWLYEDGKELRAALDQAGAWFQEYADSHTAMRKLDKAARNQERANYCKIRNSTK
jgi:hypothetical protein